MRLDRRALLPALSPLLPFRSSPTIAPRSCARQQICTKHAVDKDHLRGAVLYVAQRGQVVLHEAVGYRHFESRAPMQKDTLFRMASNTKPVVATAVMMLQEDGKLSVDDPVAKHLRSFDNAKSRGITIAQLLSHSSGLRIEPVFYPFKAREEISLQAAVAKFGAAGPKEKPGDLIQQRWLQHAGCGHRGCLGDAARGFSPAPHLQSARHVRHAESRRPGQARSDGDGVSRETARRDGGVHERVDAGRPARLSGDSRVGRHDPTAADYAKFLELLRNGGVHGGKRLLRQETVALMTTPHVRVSDETSVRVRLADWPDRDVLPLRIGRHDGVGRPGARGGWDGADAEPWRPQSRARVPREDRPGSGGPALARAAVRPVSKAFPRCLIPFSTSSPPFGTCPRNWINAGLAKIAR